MIELVVKDNIDFIRDETRRIADFGNEHYTPNGFTGLTQVGEMPFNTIDRKIGFIEIEKIMSEVGLLRVKRFKVEGLGLREGEKAPIGFGTNEVAIMCVVENGLVKIIWVNGHSKNDAVKRKLENAFFLIGQSFGFIAVDWFRCEYYDLEKDEDVEKFVANSL